MKLEIKNIKSSLNKAYLGQNLFADDLSLFKENYKAFNNSIKPNDSEETLKGYINKFLDNTFYKNKFKIKVNVNE